MERFLPMFSQTLSQELLTAGIPLTVLENRPVAQRPDVLCERIMINGEVYIGGKDEEENMLFSVAGLLITLMNQLQRPGFIRDGVVAIVPTRMGLEDKDNVYVELYTSSVC